jgi:hypothetical protein
MAMMIAQTWRDRFVTMLIAVIAAVAISNQPTFAQFRAAATSQERQIYRAFDRKDYNLAVELIQAYLKQVPDDPDMLYNLACAQCLKGDYDASAQAILDALKAGFRDFDHLRSDPDLSALRDHPTFKTILEEADKAARRPTKMNAVEHWREKYGEKDYRYEYDAEHRINYATALDETSHKEMREMLKKQADQMIESLFEHPPDYDVLIAIPTPNDSDKFFGGDDSVGGMYQHTTRRLVSRDIGGSLRHEFFHVMHFSHMERLRQQHPLWLQEGMAALYEDYQLSADGAIKFLPNDRQIIVKSRAKAGKLIKWSEIMAMSADEFMEKAQQTYPQTRSMFEFVAENGKLREWYTTYIKNFHEDRTGTKAFELTFDKPVEDIERDWRKWIAQQPQIDLVIRADDAALGIRSRENGSNDGVSIADVVPGSAAANAGLRKGDVIVAIDSQSTRSIMDLRRIIAGHEVGDHVEVRLRRKGEYHTITVRLRPAYSTS